MSFLSDILSAYTHRAALRYWSRAAETAPGADAETLKTLRNEARQLRRRIDQALHVADGRLTVPMPGNAPIRRHPQSDWAHRPEIWTGPVSPPGYASIASRTRIGSQAAIYHDCRRTELTVRQIRNQRASDVAPFGLRMDVFTFDGTFLSLAIDLPDSVLTKLTKNHLIRLEMIVETEKPIEIFARLNLKHGPNAEQVVREFEASDGEIAVEFDLAYTNLKQKPAEKLWLDLIFESPSMNQVVIRDLTLARRPRAGL